jgi:hypothetical protein
MTTTRVKKALGSIAALSAAVMLTVSAVPGCMDGGGGSDADSDSDSDGDADEGYIEGQCEFFDVMFSPAGSLAKTDSLYYGYCAYSDSNNLFEFEVGNAELTDIDSAAETYVKFTGIVGPPVDGVYSDAVAKIPKDDEALRTVFGTAIIANGGNEFVFGQPEDATTCYVKLFAAAAEGDVTMVAEEEFEYFVELQCAGLDGVSSGSTNLTGFNGYFFFDGCE